MKFFDRVKEENINGTFDVFAIDEHINKAYLLRNADICTTESQLEGFRLRISCGPEKYEYRGHFKTGSEMQEFAESVSRLMNEARTKNYPRQPPDHKSGD
jgi:hypothetical protein